uniref:EF-hand domain-containing protein n=1 Tax=Eucampia antarctica TaxID=49252 RepID=A0A7S2RE92_9STRA|mmetsp:Transcript_20919/g.20125  ORF Transcript_20919/g.20125 Transcript_20919/m.20125 type:complete len:283 (+) Transcript_20919:50-898(+)
MATESTPLTKGNLENAGKRLADAGNQIKGKALECLTEENLEKAGKHLADAGNQVKGKALDLVNSAGNDFMPLHVLSVLGGLAVTSSSAFNFILNLITLNICGAIMEFYCTLLGGVIVLIEISKLVTFTKSFEKFIDEYVYILGFVSGRGIFYFIVGTLKLTQFNVINLVAGCFMCFVGIIYYIIGLSIAKKFEKIRTGVFGNINLRIKFQTADTNGTGFLNMEEFHKLLQELEVDLDKRETKMAFSQLDKNGDYVVSFEEFEKFCEEFKFGREQNAIIDSYV